MQAKDSKEVPVNNSSAPLRPIHHSSVTLAQLAEVVGAVREGGIEPVRVNGVSMDSRAICAGDLYVALPGTRAHGAQFAAQAVAGGAIAILTDDAGAEVLGKACAVPVLTVADPRAVTGVLAATIYGTCAGTARASGVSALENMDLFGVTGTNGKTTTTYFLNSLVKAQGKTTGLIGTIEILAGSESIPSKLTTPESTDVHALLAVMAERGLGAASMEVSSHALAFGRVDSVVFDVAGFTNLTQDHLDLHGGMEEYFATKAALFTPQHARAAVITIDDAWGQRMARTSTVPTVTLSTLTLAAREGRAATESSADWQVQDIRRDGIGSRFNLCGPDGAILTVRTGLPGEFNVSNAALALLMVLTRLLGVDTGTDSGVVRRGSKSAKDVVRELQSVLEAHDPFTIEVPGRMQLIGTAPVAVVDFAHNPDALKRALAAVRPDSPAAKVIVVFGATGERDVTKRPLMGAVVARGADVVIITDDDPHDEDPAAIRAAVLAGARETNELECLGRVVEEHGSRAAAIERAVELARAEDVILVAGRGHEIYQEVKGVNISLDDRVELRAALTSHGFPLTGASKIESSTND